ncbi:MucB/RseB C-terminal domain-containing protein [Neptuniibacter sp. QD48_11]|uniref:MucB/RseB C-terminal domain-containing protein n=1 Tax=Neptuniibacter sp. QD48_11 TaxID=3398211 RepID=UPI0039F4595D
MDDRSTESVSALMDGEVADFELRRTLDRIEQEPELAEQWQRYHLVRSVMKNEEADLGGFDISGQVMQALDQEPDLEVVTAAPEVKSEIKGNSFWKPLASMTAAASVTAMVILGAQTYNQPENDTIADNRPNYVLPGNAVSDDLVRAQFGNRSMISSQGQEPEIIRLSEGVERYVSQHKHMLSHQESGWEATWLPEGFSGKRRDVMAHAEVQMFSNGRHSFTVCVEKYGRQSVPEGAVQSDGMVTVGKRIGDQFVTVVGDVPLMIAERIAASVERK